MPPRQLTQILQHLRRAECPPDTDGQLLDRFILHRDEGAFAALVRRHGPMVWGVCRRVLGDYHHAEDAFQATFLVLVRRAAAVRPREAVGNWLYGVAYQTARKARATAAKRRAREKQVPTLPEPPTPECDPMHDLRPLLDRELSRLPAKYRVPLVLCDLEGRPRKDVARQLGWPEGTLSGRLARARQALAKRLTQRGVTVSGAALAAALAEDAASATLPRDLVPATLRAALLDAAGAVAPPVTVLTEGVLKDMLFTKLTTAAAVLLAVALLAVGGGRLAVPTAAGQADGPPAAGTPPADKEKLQGVWKVVAVESGGKPQKREAIMFLVAGNRACLQSEDGEMHGGLYLDPTARPPAFDLAMSHRTFEGIYSLAGDSLRLCYDVADEAKRPRRFATQPGSRQVLLVLQRQKEFGTDLSFRRPDGSKATFPTLIEKKGQTPPPPPRVLAAPAPPAHGEYGEPAELREQVRRLERRVAALEAKLKAAPDAGDKQAVRVGQILIVGNQKTPTERIRTRLKLFPGQVIDLQALRAAERRLAEFNATVTVVENGGESGFRDILVTVKEK